MGLFNWISELFAGDPETNSIDGIILNSTDDLFSDHHIGTAWDDNEINPANGLPMIGGIGGIDVAGNPYATDSSHDDLISCGIDDPFDIGSKDDIFCSIFDDSTGCSFDDY